MMELKKNRFSPPPKEPKKTSDNTGMPAFALGNEPVDLLHVLRHQGPGFRKNGGPVILGDTIFWVQ